MESQDKKLKIEAGRCDEGLGVNIRALYDGMEGLIRTKTVVGDPIEVGGATIIPLVEVTAGLASGALLNNSRNNGAGAMNAKITPVALLIVEDGKTRLVSVRSQDVFTRLLDLIPEAVDKIKKGSVSEDIVSQAEDLANSDEIEIIEGE